MSSPRCRQVFKDTIRDLLGEDVDDQSLDSAERLWESFVDSMNALGQKPLDKVVIKELDGIIPSDVAGRNVSEVVTVLDSYINKNTESLVKDVANSFLNTFRNRSALVRVNAIITQRATSIRANAKPGSKIHDPRVAEAMALRNLLSRSADNEGTTLVLEEQKSANFTLHWFKNVLDPLQKLFPKEDMKKLLNRNMEDVITEIYMPYDDIAKGTRGTKNTEAHAIADIFIDGMGANHLALNSTGINTSARPTNILPNFNWVKIKEWVNKNGGEAVGKNKFIEFVATRLHDENGTIAQRQDIARDLYDTMNLRNGFIDWTEIASLATKDTILKSVDKNAPNAPSLRFKDGKNWLEVNNMFGEREFIGTLEKQFRFLTDQLSIVQMFGPNWRQNFKDLARSIAVKGIKKPSERDIDLFMQTAEMRKAQNDFNRLTAGPVTPSNFFIDTFLSIGRSITNASKLGSAPIIALMDVSVAKHAVQNLYGVSFFRNIDKFLAGFTDKETRRMARTMGTATSAYFSSTKNRFSMMDNAPPGTKLQRHASEVANFFMKISGLEAWTDAAGAGVTSIFRSAIGDLVAGGRTWSQINPKLRNSFKRFGIGEDDWRLLSKATVDGAGQLDVFAINDTVLQKKFLGWFKDAVDTAVIRGSLRDNVIVEPGSALEPWFKTILQFKQFPIAFFRKVGVRSFKTQNHLEFAKSMGTFTAYGMVLGVAIAQLQEIAKGNQPFELDSDELYTRAIMISSPAGIMTDMFMQAGGEAMFTTLFGTQPRTFNQALSFLGPFFGEMTKLGIILPTLVAQGGLKGAEQLGVDIGNSADLNRAIERNTSKLTQWMIRQAPGATLWQTKMAYKLFFADALHEMMDPRGYRRRQRNIKRRAKDSRVGGEAFNPIAESIIDLRKSVFK